MLGSILLHPLVLFRVHSSYVVRTSLVHIHGRPNLALHLCYAVTARLTTAATEGRRNAVASTRRIAVTPYTYDDDNADQASMPSAFSSLYSYLLQYKSTSFARRSAVTLLPTVFSVSTSSSTSSKHHETLPWYDWLYCRAILSRVSCLRRTPRPANLRRRVKILRRGTPVLQRLLRRGKSRHVLQLPSPCLSLISNVVPTMLSNPQLDRYSQHLEQDRMHRCRYL